MKKVLELKNSTSLSLSSNSWSLFLKKLRKRNPAIIFIAIVGFGFLGAENMRKVNKELTARPVNGIIFFSEKGCLFSALNTIAGFMVTGDADFVHAPGNPFSTLKKLKPVL
ncbi:hypothetical protein CDAR_454211 [Caerostris darwini]|uniref:Uncharacterized protein n=1 Tax=Caerostris darwini TaxID=1538125 RepID=A0AAV4V7J9_9ARAC|nr:hypothetical protein CDAR_454211 [Caerostris darwini]